MNPELLKKLSDRKNFVETKAQTWESSPSSSAADVVSTSPTSRLSIQGLRDGTAPEPQGKIFWTQKSGSSKSGRNQESSAPSTPTKASSPKDMPSTPPKLPTNAPQLPEAVLDTAAGKPIDYSRWASIEDSDDEDPLAGFLRHCKAKAWPDVKKAFAALEESSRARAGRVFEDRAALLGDVGGGDREACEVLGALLPYDDGSNCGSAVWTSLFAFLETNSEEAESAWKCLSCLVTQTRGASVKAAYPRLHELVRFYLDAYWRRREEFSRSRSLIFTLPMEAACKAYLRSDVADRLADKRMMTTMQCFLAWMSEEGMRCENLRIICGVLHMEARKGCLQLEQLQRCAAFREAMADIAFAPEST